jgi:thiol-disulfide isomerase/thioredoxin
LTLVSVYNQSLWATKINDENDLIRMYDSCEFHYSGELRDRVLLDWLYNIKARAAHRIEGYVKRYLHTAQDSSYIRYVVDNYSSQFEEGNFELLNSFGEGRSLDELIEFYKGKVIYIDFWASWCAPCRKEIPDAIRLREKYANCEFVYLYISIDNLVSKWREASKQDGINELTTNYLLNSFEQSTINKRYKISTRPRYILFDKKGKISNVNAPRPSELLNSKTIDSLLQQKLF